MSKINDGGLLSPWWDQNEDGTPRFVPGACTLRDYFAAQALASMVRYYETTGAMLDAETAAEVACDAYVVADAMLAARSESGQ